MGLGYSPSLRSVPRFQAGSESHRIHSVFSSCEQAGAEAEGERWDWDTVDSYSQLPGYKPVVNLI